MLTTPADGARAGAYHGLLRAWAVDDDWFPAEWVRLAELTDYDGLVNVVVLRPRDS
ncbi:hypothetical protein [Nocardioides renjunii]|uniref:hypothetical protein n=1 Tax=Nocardioides renjunii TaxID=3095075 RepID=UPI002AFF4DC0|nr:hypothetical protein [Nocardioides sp. S-34]WQQ21410.1 hypothetical protein SHK17_16110 [Nocardioides sp. S-34]